MASGSEKPRRRQDHCCDQCRRWKRRCDAPVRTRHELHGVNKPESAPQKGLNDSGFTACSNCKKYNRECTFDWLSKRTRSRRYQCRPSYESSRTLPQQQDELLSSIGPQSPDSNVIFDSSLSDPLSWNYASGVGTFNLPLLWRTEQSNTDPESLGNDVGDFASTVNVYGCRRTGDGIPRTLSFFEGSDGQPSFDSPYVFDQIEECRAQSYNQSESCFDGEPFEHINGIFQRSRQPTEAEDRTEHERDFCILSDRTATEHTRSMMTQNLIRIYHDSMENALSCWLTERNCPYSHRGDIVSRKEWGTNWTNRICARICRLDQASSSVRGRALSLAENRTAARVLHLSIMAFALQWAQHFQNDIDQPITAPVARYERRFRTSVWKQARHALQESCGIPSFRLIFANIIFSLIQQPLEEERNSGMEEILQNDGAVVFLQTAVRQMFNFRYKLAQLQRWDSKHTTRLGESPTKWMVGSMPKVQNTSSVESKSCLSPDTDSFLTSPEYRDTFNLLFWLGVMFDTQTAAMNQRPPVISDDDSGVRSVSPEVSRDGDIDLDGWNILPSETRKENEDLWGDLFLHKSLSKGIKRWPCSYEEAAAILSDGAPVKILLYRRVTQLQTLIYRGARPESLERGIEKALQVYAHWSNTFNRFICDCIANHTFLPPRIQSWYVVLAAHWHLGAMLLADVIESIDERKLSSVSRRKSRRSMDFVSTIRKDNAFAVAALARCSLHSQESVHPRQFHDSLAEAAFLTEPFTVLLIHSFARAGYICLNNISASSALVNYESSDMFERLRECCEVCIGALRCLGRKSDMASLVACKLRKQLDLKLQSQSPGYDATVLEWPVHIDSLLSAGDSSSDSFRGMFMLDEGICTL